LSPAVLDAVEPSELADVCSLHVALGRAFNGAGRNAESALSFYDALRVSNHLLLSVLKEPRFNLSDLFYFFSSFLDLACPKECQQSGRPQHGIPCLRWPVRVSKSKLYRTRGE